MVLVLVLVTMVVEEKLQGWLEQCVMMLLLMFLLERRKEEE